MLVGLKLVLLRVIRNEEKTVNSVQSIYFSNILAELIMEKAPRIIKNTPHIPSTIR